MTMMMLAYCTSSSSSRVKRRRRGGTNLMILRMRRHTKVRLRVTEIERLVAVAPRAPTMMRASSLFQWSWKKSRGPKATMMRSASRMMTMRRAWSVKASRFALCSTSQEAWKPAMRMTTRNWTTTKGLFCTISWRTKVDRTFWGGSRWLTGDSSRMRARYRRYWSLSLISLLCCLARILYPSMMKATKRFITKKAPMTMKTTKKAACHVLAPGEGCVSGDVMEVHVLTRSPYLSVPTVKRLRTARPKLSKWYSGTNQACGRYSTPPTGEGTAELPEHWARLGVVAAVQYPSLP
mmetsp:Transcript_3142/g.7638  ORF Transcript_3142/g.7638 Transcript_3142/m.7638 type:complete len:293 (-) Transcript_3142:48-926(-)